MSNIRYQRGVLEGEGQEMTNIRHQRGEARNANIRYLRGRG